MLPCNQADGKGNCVPSRPLAHIIAFFLYVKGCPTAYRTHLGAGLSLDIQRLYCLPVREASNIR